MRDFWPQLSSVLNRGHRVFLAMVVDNTPGSPGTVGARMFLAGEGVQVGTIGGGAMEFQLLERARQALAEGAATRLQTLWHREDAPGERSGMICAGRQTNLYHVCTPERDGDLIARLARCVEEGRAATLRVDETGLHLTDAPVDLARPPKRLTQGDGEWFYEEQVLNLKRLAIIGGGHCGLALSRVMDQVGYDVIVLDRRGDLDLLSHNDHAREKHVVGDYAEAGRVIAYPETTRVVVMTTDYPSDVRALAGVLPYPFPFMGVMGSAAKIGRIMRDLRDQGIEQSTLDRLHAPVGLKIHSHTPEEIAISIAAELLKEAPHISAAALGLGEAGATQGAST